ncbi:MAG: zinc-ribbon domain-containing protein [Promicromonosporaceae bacterium]|nr:zinc-ribbon domain-containing protein [Promicromonosporaceae bacterium]
MPGGRTVAETHVADQWSPRNALAASEVPASSGEQGWWVCDAGHEWSARIVGRTVRVSGCPYCSGRRRIPGVNDFATLHPELLALWHPGNDVDPTAIGPRSNRRVRWTCDDGHEWEAPVSTLTGGHGCPYCSRRFTTSGVNDLATTHPDLAREWDEPTLAAGSVTSGSSRKVAWQCRSCGHRWRATVVSRAHAGTGCPECGRRAGADRRALPKPGRSLVELFPDVAALWHPTRNSAAPGEVAASSRRRVWWLCPDCDHAWQAAPGDRTFYSTGCPACSYATRGRARMVPAAGASLAVVSPALAAEWADPDLGAADVGPFSDYLALWRCDEGHRWRATVGNRSAGTGCPVCRPRSRGEADLRAVLATLVPGIEIRANDRRAVPGHELDAYLPDLAVAVEYNGVYYHREQFRSRDAHASKLAAARAAGIRLVTVWEDDWLARREIVVRALAARLGVTAGLRLTRPELAPECSERVGARSLTVREVTGRVANEFLAGNHLQGPVTCSRRFALVDDAGRVRALLALRSARGGARSRRAEGEWEIVRFATRGIVPGAFSRLLAHAERALAGDLTRWVTFADAMISDGALYERTGFVADRRLAPDYRYAGPSTRWVRQPKESYQRRRFRDDPDLVWDESWTEAVAAERNGLHRVWDAGKTRYVRDVVVPQEDET